MLLKNIKIFIINIKNKIQNDNISAYAAQCAYFTILSAIPFLLVLLTLIQYTNISKETIIRIMESLVPSNFHGIAIDIIQEIYSKSAVAISAATLVALWSAGRGFFALLLGLNQIYGIKRNGNNYIYFRIRGIVCTIGLILAMILALLVIIFGNTISEFIINNFNVLSSIFFNLLKFRSIFILIILFIFFTILYKVAPNHKVKFNSQVIGGLFSAINWYVISYIFSRYLDIFKGFSILYGSLTTIILLMMWVYYCMYVILMGAEINKIAQLHRKSKEIV